MSQNSPNLIILSILLLVIVNMVFLDIVQFSPRTQPLTTTVTSTLATPPTSECSAVCQKLIADEVTKQLAVKPATPTPQVAIGAPAAVAKEYYVPLGTGLTRNSSYDPLPGAVVSVNTNNYPNIQKVIFEIFLRNPTGNGTTFAKLYNVTDQHDVWFSEVSFVGGGTARREATIQLEPGNKEYQVMLKSTLQYDVYVDNARLKITTY